MSDVKEPEKESEEKTEITPSRINKNRPVFCSLDDAFEDFIRHWNELAFPRLLEEYEPIVQYPIADLEDNGDSYVFTAEVPGLSKDQVKINVTKDGLDVRGEVKEEKEEKDKDYIERERSYSAIRRYVEFPEEVIPDKAEATIKSGVLTVKVPKKEPTPKEEPTKVEVKEE